MGRRKRKRSKRRKRIFRLFRMDLGLAHGVFGLGDCLMGRGRRLEVASYVSMGIFTLCSGTF